MIEYIFDAVRATAGNDIVINANITDDTGTDIKEQCYLSFQDEEKELSCFDGVYENGCWSFKLPAQETAGKSGRYWYVIGSRKTALSFKQPLYLV